MGWDCEREFYQFIFKSNAAAQPIKSFHCWKFILVLLRLHMPRWHYNNSSHSVESADVKKHTTYKIAVSQSIACSCVLMCMTRMQVM